MDAEEFGGLKQEVKGEHTIYELFKWSLLIKGAISLGEVAVGLLTLFLPSTWILAGVAWVHSLFPGTHGALVTHALTEIDRVSAATVVFVSLYLLSRGIIKLFLVWSLLRNQLWAYPASLVVLGLFIAYQTYQIITGGSVFVIFITLFDLVVVYFIWREYRIVLRHQRRRS